MSLCSEKDELFWTDRTHPAWEEIVTELKDQGVVDVDATKLYRKFGNLKKTYLRIRKKQLSDPDSCQPKWRFYNQMAAIIKKDQWELPEKQQSSMEEISIRSCEDAMDHLHALQEYAMFRDNYRAIGLLMQAEYAFKHPPDNKDFEL